jgi:hypothetical protein
LRGGFDERDLVDIEAVRAEVQEVDVAGGDNMAGEEAGEQDEGMVFPPTMEVDVLDVAKQGESSRNASVRKGNGLEFLEDQHLPISGEPKSVEKRKLPRGGEKGEKHMDPESRRERKRARAERRAEKEQQRSSAKRSAQSGGLQPKKFFVGVGAAKAVGGGRERPIDIWESSTGKRPAGEW